MQPVYSDNQQKVSIQKIKTSFRLILASALNLLFNAVRRLNCVGHSIGQKQPHFSPVYLGAKTLTLSAFFKP